MMWMDERWEGDRSLYRRVPVTAMCFLVFTHAKKTDFQDAAPKPPEPKLHRAVRQMVHHECERKDGGRFSRTEFGATSALDITSAIYDRLNHQNILRNRKRKCNDSNEYD